MGFWNDFIDERRAQGWANLFADLGYGSITYCPFDSLPKPAGAAQDAWTVEVVNALRSRGRGGRQERSQNDSHRQG